MLVINKLRKSLVVHLIDLQKIVDSSGTLLTLPDICLQLKQIANDPHSSAADLSALIGKDPALTARLLKLVNSSLYSFPKQISSLSQAITLVGTKQLYTLALATSSAAIIRAAGGGYVELKTLWKHAVYSAFIAQDIASQKKEKKESLFIAGLLCDIGTLAVVKYAPDIAMSAIAPPNSNQPPWKREKEVLGFSMAEARASLLDTWNLPNEIIVPIRHQHSPVNAKEHTLSACILHIATRLASDTLSQEQGQEQKCLQPIEKYALTTTDLSQDDLESIMAKAKEAGPTMLRIFTLS